MASIRSTLARGLALGSLLLCAVPAAARNALSPPPQDGRDISGISEEQELLKRQLERLRRTMEGLIPRLEKEGRPHALELLKEGLKQLDQRPPEAKSLTLQELMDSARTALESGQAVQSLETQELVVQGLERLLAILLDRESLDNLQQSLDELKAIQKEIQELSSREAQLERDTRALEESSASPEQKALRAQLDQLIAKQRELTSKHETLGRESRGMELENLVRALRELAERQAIDRAVLESWKPGERESLESAKPSLEQARSAADRAQRLRDAARALREGAQNARQADNAGEMQSNAQALETAAEREERHARASGDEAAKQSAQELRGGAEDLRAAGPSAEGQTAAAQSLERRAEKLEQAAAAAEAQAAAARDEAQKQLGEIAAKAGESKSAAASAAEQASAALERAASARPSAPQGAPQGSDSTRAAEAARDAAEAARQAAQATDEALQALQRGVSEQRQLGPVLSASQADANKRAEEIRGGLESLPQAAGTDGAQAQAELQRAAEAMREAAQAARAEQSSQAADAAKRAEDALKAAEQALARMQQSAASSGSPEQQAQSSQLASEQGQLAESAGQAQSQAGQAGLEQESESAVEQGLQEAREAMERAAEEMQSGRPASAAGSQREAMQKLEEARDAATSGVRPSSPQDKARAEELAKAQEEIRKKLLDLATRNRERKNAKPTPSLDQAGKQAQRAKGSLDEGDLDEAQEAEQEVQRELNQAQETLADEEEQYQRLRQEELLFKIAEELAALVKTHREAMAAVREIDATREADEKPGRAQRLRLRRVAKDEAGLAARSGELAAALAVEGSLVFENALKGMQQDLERIARDLDETGDYQTGSRVQALQQDVDEAAQWLLDALKAERDRRQQEQKQEQGQNQPAQDGEQKPRLVPDAAELKLLARMEVDIVDRLNEMLALYPELASKDVDPLVLEDIQRLAERHERATRLFAKLRERLGLPDPEGEKQ